jgi:hypothetical protein
MVIERKTRKPGSLPGFLLESMPINYFVTP